MESTAEPDRRRWLLTFAVIIGAICVLAWWLYRSPTPDPALLLTDDGAVDATDRDAVNAGAGSELGVDVIGAVQRPGLYFFESGARVADAIRAAGGYTPNADREAVNEALRLQDEQQLRVPHLVTRSEHTAGAMPAAAAPVVATAPPLIDLNTADVVVLEALPGIGPVMAQRIVDFRASNGAFDSVEQLEHVPGIGPATFSTLRDLVTVAP